MEELDPHELYHHKFNWEKAYKYAREMEEGDIFPPIIVKRGFKGHLKVHDGAHRTAAHKLLGRKKIKAFVQDV